MNKLQTNFNNTQENNILLINKNFFIEKINAIFDINSKISIPNKIEILAKNKGLSIKKDFHITVIWSRTGEKIQEILQNKNEKDKIEIIAKIKQIYESIDWKIDLSEDYYYIEKDYNKDWIFEKRSSIVQLLRLIWLEEFYEKLNNLLWTNFEIPLPHITLYTTSTREDMRQRGIGVYSDKQFKELNPIKIEV